MKESKSELGLSKLDAIVTIAIFSTLFFSSYILFKEPFEFYLPYLFVVLLLPFFLLKFGVSKQIIQVLSPLLLFGLLSVWKGDNTINLFFKIFINLLISLSFYFYVFQTYKLDVNKLFSYYMKGAVIVSILGLIQFICFQLGITPGYDFFWLGLNKWGVYTGGSFGIRINSIFSEPSYYGGAIGPALFVSLYNLVVKKKNFITNMQSIIVILVYFLTFSSVAYIGFFVSLVLLLINFGFIRYVLVFAPLIIGGYIYLYANVEEFRARVDGLDALYSEKATSSFQVHGSSFVQYNNAHIATENFKRNPLFGTGLGSHQIAYGRYSLAKQFGGINEFNQSDANSMFLRLMSETGLYGIIFIFLFIGKYFVLKSNSDPDDNLWLISSAALVAILLQLLRQGNYTYNGFMFYMWLYYYVKLRWKEQKVLNLEPELI